MVSFVLYGFKRSRRPVVRQPRTAKDGALGTIAERTKVKAAPRSSPPEELRAGAGGRLEG